MTYPYSTRPQRYNGSRITRGTLETYVYVESLDEDFRVKLDIVHTYEQGDRWTPDWTDWEITGTEILEAVTGSTKTLIEEAVERTGDELIEREWEAIRWE